MARYPYAMPDDGKTSSHARAAKNMKQELKRAFPYVKFSVTSDSFSMGNSINVSWDNGAAAESVNAIVKKYQYYIDKCTNDTSNEARAVAIVLGQSKYVSTSRNLSDDLREQVGRDICKEYGEEYDVNAKIGGRWLSECVYIALGVDITGDYDGVKLVNNEMLAQFKPAEIKQATATNTGTAEEPARDLRDEPVGLPSSVDITLSFAPKTGPGAHVPGLTVCYLQASLAFGAASSRFLEFQGRFLPSQRSTIFCPRCQSHATLPFT